MGGTQKAWMMGQSSKSSRQSFAPNVSVAKVTDQATKISHRAELVPERYKTGNDNEFPNSVFGPNFDRGRYPAHRSRHGGTNSYAGPSLNGIAVASTPPILSSPALEENANTASIIPMDISINAENVLPSPSPSVEARQKSVNVIEIEDEDSPPQATEAQPVEGPKATLEDFVAQCGGMEQFEKLLIDAGKSNYGPSQIAASAITQKSSEAGLSSGPPFQRQSSLFQNQTRSDSDQGVQVPSIAHKRPQEITDEPRKRLQSLLGSSSEVPVTIPSTTTTLPNQNHQCNAAASPSGNEMHSFAQGLAQRIQQVANLPSRQGSHVERPRLELLREACKTSDYFYLILHQLFCFDYQIRKSKGYVPSLNEIHRKGLDVVAFLLVSNDDMVDDAVAWFAVFPLPLGKSLFTSAHAKVLRCLEKMACSWNELRSRCRERRRPPLVDELVVLFNVESFLFQQIIFRAVLRDIWSYQANDCNCFLIAEGVFNRDYKSVMDRLLSGSTTDELVNFYQQAVIREYEQVIGSHWQHTNAGSAVNIAAPVQQRRQSRLAPAVNRLSNPNKSQYEHNKNAQPPLTLNLHTVKRHSLSAASGPVPIAAQETLAARHGSLVSQSQALLSNVFPSPQMGNFTQSPTTLQGLLSPEASINVSWHSNNQQQQKERRTSSTAGTIRNAPRSATSTHRTPHVVPSNVPGNSPIHQSQQALGYQQQSYNSVPSSTGADPRARPPHEVRRSLSNRASATTMPILSPHPFIHSSSSLPIDANSTPFIRSYPPLPAHPNPTTYALHQAHLRSPTLSCLDPNKKPNSMAKYYRFIKHVLMPPEELDGKNRHVNWEFGVSKELINWFAHDSPSSYGAPPTRAVMPGSRLCRIRCINLKDKSGMPTQSQWVAADNVWPGSTAIVLNGIALDIRKKTHHGKDLPVDVTRYIKVGQNNLSTAVIGVEKDSTKRYAIGVEFIQVVDEQQIKTEIRNFPWFEARKRILDQSKNTDPDIEVVQSQKVLDLTDPFTARIFDVPVRGINCHHNQCFDRDTFLQTRTVKNPGEPCGPDEFRCPICGQDARPQSLMIDGFFLGVRMTLEARGRLDVKAIVLRESGEWDIKEEEGATGESGDGTGRRRSAGLPRSRTGSASAAKQTVPREVIALDDD